jgi:hypothetical protein
MDLIKVRELVQLANLGALHASLSVTEANSLLPAQVVHCLELLLLSLRRLMVAFLIIKTFQM